MMKVTVKAPANRFTDAQTVSYWLPYSQFGETKDLFVKGQSDPWYCASNLSVGLANWNNESKLSSSAKPAKLISLIEFHMSEDIDIGNEITDLCKPSDAVNINNTSRHEGSSSNEDNNNSTSQNNNSSSRSSNNNNNQRSNGGSRDCDNNNNRGDKVDDKRDGSYSRKNNK